MFSSARGKIEFTNQFYYVMVLCACTKQKNQKIGKQCRMSFYFRNYPPQQFPEARQRRGDRFDECAIYIRADRL